MHAVGRRMFSPATAPARRRRGFVVIGLAKLLEGEKMDDKQVVAAILALALHSALNQETTEKGHKTLA